MVTQTPRTPPSLPGGAWRSQESRLRRLFVGKAFSLVWLTLWAIRGCSGRIGDVYIS